LSWYVIKIDDALRQKVASTSHPPKLFSDKSKVHPKTDISRQISGHLCRNVFRENIYREDGLTEGAKR
jgi:hypothetical protein